MLHMSAHHRGFLLACGMATAACAGDDPVDPFESVPESVLVVPETVTLAALDDTVRLTATVFNLYGRVLTDTDLAWAVQDGSIATVSPAGLVTAVANGSTGVVAVSGLAKGSVSLTVEQQAVEMQVSPRPDTLRALDDTLRLFAQAVDANGYPIEGISLAWSSNDESIATVDATGLITTIRPGVAEITVEAVGTGVVDFVQLVIDLRARDILTTLYHATDGPNWTNSDNWLTAAPLDSWYGVTVSDQTVDGLNLCHNGLRGEIPKHLGYLPNLEGLWLHQNGLTGPIPPELGNLKQLRILYAAENALTGPIPPELSGLDSLFKLVLTDNELEGPIPPELGSLAELRDLALALNKLTGGIPPELTNLRNLRYLILYRNELTGPIPSGLGKLSLLRELWLHLNQLTGSIPKELGELRQLTRLSLSVKQAHRPNSIGTCRLGTTGGGGSSRQRAHGPDSPGAGKAVTRLDIAPKRQ